jgi:hypothetical protein
MSDDSHDPASPPGPADPGPADLGPGDPGPADPGPADPGPGDPGPGDPGPADPGPGYPGPGDPGPADPGPGYPGPGDPGPADPGTGPAGPSADSATEPVAGAGGLLADMRALRRDARSARHAYWLPLVYFGLLAAASVPLYLRPAPIRSGAVSTGPLGASLPYFSGGLGTDPGAVAYYWLAGLLSGLLVTLIWYRWHARRVGLASPHRAYLIITAVVTAAAIAIPPLSGLSGLGRLAVLWPGDLIIRGTFPLVIIAIGLFALAWAERSPALAVITAIYGAVALISSLYDVENVLYRLGWTVSQAASSLPNLLLPAAVLLLSGAGAFAAQRLRHPARRPA